MKHYLGPVFAIAACVTLACVSAHAQTTERMVIALKTDDFELTETDISTMAVGEAQTIVSQSGKIIDILRTSEGAEVYVDGELLEMHLDDENLHQEHIVEKHVEIECETGEECEETVFILADDGGEASESVMIDLHKLHEEHGSGEEHKVIIIRKEQITED